MKLRIIIEDDEGGVLATRKKEFDDHFDLDAHDWNDDKREMLAEVMED